MTDPKSAAADEEDAPSTSAGAEPQLTDPNRTPERIEIDDVVAAIERQQERRRQAAFERYEERAKTPSYAVELQDALGLFTEVHTFARGQLVRWKRGMKNKRRPAYGIPVVVLEQLDEPRYDTTQGGGSAYFREPLDLICGLIDEDGDFITLHFDSRRLEPYTHPE